MPDDFRDRILRAVRRLFPADAASGATDADLLLRFAHGHDETAFELLVWRHAALVLHVCRQVLRDEQAAEDAFQATFLVLVKKAGSVLRGEALPGWLHRVAFRAALKARPRRAVRTGVDLDSVPGAEPPADGGEREALHEEIARLPAKYRQPIVCCYIEGKTHEEAAKELGWPKGTVAGRLSRARDLLRARLTRRGLSLGAGPELAAGAAMARRVAGLLAGLRNPSSLPPAVVALAEGVIHVMFWTKLKWAAILVVGICAVGVAGGGLAARRGPAVEAPAGAPDDRVEQEKPRDPVERQPAEVPDDPLKDATDRAVVRSQLKALALAMHNYHDTYTHFPPAAITDAAGKPLLSWRVALLPFLDQHELYKQFKLNEPWDGPHNKKLIARMPRVFAPVAGKARVPNSTYYQLLVGPGAIYSGQQPFGAAGGMGAPGLLPGTGATGLAGGGEGGAAGPGAAGPGLGRPAPGGRGAPPGAPGMPGPAGMMGAGRGGMMPGGPGGMGGAGMMPGPTGPVLVQISDGTSNTILIAEAGEAVPWTKPVDIPFDPRKPLPKLGGQFPHTFHVAFADGSVRSLPKSLDPATFRAAITANGGEPFDLDKAGKPPVSPARQRMLDRLRDRKEKLHEEAVILAEVLGEMRAELDNLRWEVEREKLLTLDADAAALQRENEKLEKSLREGREQARKMMRELRNLKEEMRKREAKPE